MAKSAARTEQETARINAAKWRKDHPFLIHATEQELAEQIKRAQAHDVHHGRLVFMAEAFKGRRV